MVMTRFKQRSIRIGISYLTKSRQSILMYPKTYLEVEGSLFMLSWLSRVSSSVWRRTDYLMYPTVNIHLSVKRWSGCCFRKRAALRLER